MTRLPWVKYWYADWTGDMALQQCSLAARGAWHETLCYFWHEGIFEYRATPAEWALLWRCSEAESATIIEEIHNRKVGDVTLHKDASVTLRSRRLYKEHKQRQQARLRKQKQRGHAPVPPMSQDPVTPCVTDRGQEAKRPRGQEAKKPRGSKPPAAVKRPPKVVTDLADAVGVKVSLVVEKLQRGNPLEWIVAWLLYAQANPGLVRSPSGLLVKMLDEKRTPKEDYMAEAKALLELPAADLGFSDALSSVPREPGMNQKRNAALDGLEDAG